MKTQTGSDTEFNESIINDINRDDFIVASGGDKKTRSLAVRRMIEYRQEQKFLKEQIDTWGFEDDIDFEH